MIHKMSIIIALGFSSSVFSSFTLADETKSFGIGIGVMYNGLGVSYGTQKKDSYKYASLGCLNASESSSRGTEVNCGAGLGYITTTLISNTENNHGVGAHVGATYNEVHGFNEVELFVAPQYVYFLNGINKSGFNLGANIFLGKHDGKSEAGAGLQIGYQF